MKVALDHHYTARIASKLCDRGHDVIAIPERGWEQESDERLLELSHADDRALLTNNVADFAVLAREWAATGRHHAGLIFTSDASLPRGMSTVGRYVDLLDALLNAHTAPRAFEDRVHWL